MGSVSGPASRRWASQTQLQGSCFSQRRQRRLPLALPGAPVPACPQGPPPVPPGPPVPPASNGLTLLLCPYFAEVELPLKKDGFTSESTTLEALLRGEGVEKKADAREEESMQEIQVFPCLPWGLRLECEPCASESPTWACLFPPDPCTRLRLGALWVPFCCDWSSRTSSHPSLSGSHVAIQNIFFWPAVCQVPG